MQARHVTSLSDYRIPFGAAQLGGTVKLSIDVWEDEPRAVDLRLWIDGEGERLIPMQPGSGNGSAVRYAAEFAPEKTGVIWYSFNITSSDGSVWRYGAREEHAVGEGAFHYGDPPSFQITVYEPRAVQPDWYRNGIVYQIFPDRFARGDDWRERAKTLDAPRKGPKRRLVEDWDKPVSYEFDEKAGEMLAWDFYGGTLEGIREKLGYLEALGITALYLNPIFEATSNHRYDTADYERIDPLLGDEESFRALCADAEARGISIILDGVFNHTGRDSRYFNALGNYPDVGAAQDPSSPYHTWYKMEEDGSYSCWWGVKDLPDIEETDPGYRDYINGEDGIVRRWLRAGARGWRLDVADELPDSFIRELKAAATAEKDDALVIGEVWEDATHKWAYGELRQYFQGEELDGVMNYPLRAGILRFLTGKATAFELSDVLEQLIENYPPEALANCLNVLGTHDRMRLFTILGGAPEQDELTDAKRAAYKLDDGQKALARSRLWLAALLQMTLPGVPCVYYGDEAGLEGFRDPYNRGTFPWEGGDPYCPTIYRNAIGVRKALPVLVNGTCEPFSEGEDVFGFWRRDDDDGSCVCVLVNASTKKTHEVELPMAASQVTDVISGRVPLVSDDGKTCTVTLWPLGSAVLHFHEAERLQRPLEPGVGVLAHITSLPDRMAPGKPGTMHSALSFIDWLHEAGVRYWQILPINPTDKWGSPYAGLSAFAGNPALMPSHNSEGMRLAEKDVKRGCRFVRENAAWLEPYACFTAIKELLGDDSPWWEWPEKYRTYTPELLKDKALKLGIRRCMAQQMLFQGDWEFTRDYANERGISIIGDMPMYVAADSADVWAHPDIFNPALLAGAPPDPLAPDGQLWGNPTFRWDVVAASGFDWWMQRLARMFKLYDYVRLDHFVGFSSYFGIPAGTTAADGTWIFGPGKALFQAAYDRFGPLPILAEDLGTITPGVRALLAEVGAPGMSVVQFAGGDVFKSFKPAPDTVAFTGTHDTATILEWCEGNAEKDETPEETRERAIKLCERVVSADADVAILPLQDVLLLGVEGRMNRPGTAGGWGWYADPQDIEDVSARLKRLVELHRA